jgi:putative transcriptional regulator
MRALWAFLALIAISWPTAADDPKAAKAILLVARTDLPDPHFRDSVVLVLNNIGPAPVGVIVNRPTGVAVSHALPDLDRPPPPGERIYFGGPVRLGAVTFLFRADQPPDNAIEVVAGVYLGTDRELLRKLLSREKPMDGLRIFTGYSSWAPGQLEAELARGDWTLAPASADAIFDAKSAPAWPMPTTPRGARRI